MEISPKWPCLTWVPLGQDGLVLQEWVQSAGQEPRYRQGGTGKLRSTAQRHQSLSEKRVR